MHTRTGQPRNLVAGGAVAYQQWHPSVSVLFADIVDFPALIASCQPEQVGVKEASSVTRQEGTLSTMGLQTLPWCHQCS
jgi:hypothetical protein